MRLRQKPWADQEFAENPLFVPNPKEHKGTWRDIFANDNPIHLEIGCGKGRFVIENALAQPHINFLAMEKQERILCMALRSGRDADLPPNLRFFCQEAENLQDIFGPAELARIYINFCDPWRARGKWRKRRLTHRDFLAVYQTIMGGGQVHFKTDDEVLFNFSVTEFKETGWRLDNVTTDLHNSGAGNIMTEYEARFAAKGMKIYRLEADKS
ncbi:MAG: tRNA (guanosine(46)-N7)-methyltransferase TrmB [Defluviitaleaceae bacterium]|nr:tRNA (guanosine(46)-N7)-methyltransferase TrmB [Defluviitaleaceae bacterium]